MRTYPRLAVVAVAIAAAFQASPCQAQWPATTRGTHHHHFLEVGGRAYDRPGTESNAAIITDSETGGTLFNAGEASDAGSAPGLELRYGFKGPYDRDLEFRAIVAEFDVSRELISSQIASDLFGEIDTSTTLNSFEYEYDSNFYSLGVMSCRSLRDGLRFKFGPRYMRLEDTVTASVNSDTAVFVAPGVFQAVNVDSVTETRADNNLIGLQGGLDLRMPISQQIYTTGFFNIGGFYNPTEVERRTGANLSGSAINLTPDGEISKSTGSFLAELGGRIYVDLIKDSVAGYAGYEATWIDGIALAPAQLTSSTATTGLGTDVDTANTLFFHAFTFGLRMNF